MAVPETLITLGCDGMPHGAAYPTFSVNNSNSASSTTVTVYQAGTYTFVVTLLGDVSGLVNNAQLRHCDRGPDAHVGRGQPRPDRSGGGTIASTDGNGL